MRASLALAGLALLAAGVSLAGPAQAAETCQEKLVTISDSDGGTVEGTDGNDVFLVSGPGITIVAKGGNDTICTADGYVAAGHEDVDVDTAAGPDHVRLVVNDRFGGSVGSVDEGDGLDILSVVLTRSGTNIFLPRGFISTVEGATSLAGAENVFASGRWVRIYGNRDDNELSADGCRVTLVGGQGADLLRVVNGHWSSRSCGDRQQWLRGRGGPDRLFGGELGDILQGGSGRDSAVGNRGIDRCMAEKEKSCER